MSELSDEEIRKMPLKTRCEQFQKEYNELAHKWGVDFTPILVPTQQTLEARLGYKDLFVPHGQPQKSPTIN